METKFILATIIGILLGNGIAWAFPPIQWIKRKLRIDSDTYQNLQGLYDVETSLGIGKGIHRLIGKAFNCAQCCSWWSGLAVVLIYPEWWIVGSAFCAFTASAMIEKHYNQQ